MQGTEPGSLRLLASCGKQQPGSTLISTSRRLAVNLFEYGHPPQRHALFMRRMDFSRQIEYGWGGSLIKSRTVEAFPDHQPNVDVRRCWNISTISRHQGFKLWLFPASIAGSFLPVTEVLMGSCRTHHPCAWGKPRATRTNAANLNFVQKLFTFLQRTRRKLWI